MIYKSNVTQGTELKGARKLFSSKQNLKLHVIVLDINKGNSNTLYRLQFQTSMLMAVARRGFRNFPVITRLHLLNGRCIYNGCLWENIVRESSLHLPMLLTQGTPVHAAVYTTWITRWVLHSSTELVRKS